MPHKEAVAAVLVLVRSTMASYLLPKQTGHDELRYSAKIDFRGDFNEYSRIFMSSKFL
jgi:hypothetical protein